MGQARGATNFSQHIQWNSERKSRPHFFVSNHQHESVIETLGPAAGRPRVDTLKGPKHAYMKELQFDADDGVWRAAFAFDPKREAVIPHF